MEKCHWSHKMNQYTKRDAIIDICARTYQARFDAGFTQRELAQRMGLNTLTYAKYETRSAMPTYLVAEFCSQTGTNSHWLLTGQGEQHAPTKRAG